MFIHFDQFIGSKVPSESKFKAPAAFKAWMDMPAHLRPAPSPTDMGCLPNYTTQMARCLKRPVELAVDPKWSTDLFNMNEWLAGNFGVMSRSFSILFML